MDARAGDTKSAVKRLFVPKCFRRSLTVASHWEATTLAGRLFHKRGAAALKARSSAVLSRVRRTPSLWDDADRSRLRDSTSHCCSLARYSGAIWLRQQNTRMTRRNSVCILECIASAGRAEVVRCGRIYNRYTPVFLLRWALTADDPSDALWCRWVWCCRSRDDRTIAVTSDSRMGLEMERRMLHMWRRDA